jgi:predicted transcriptional regulator
MNNTRSTSKENMLSLIALYLEGGLTPKQFSERNKITRSKFYYWLNRYKSEKNKISGFIPISVKDKTKVESVVANKSELVSEIFRIELPNGTNIIFKEMPDNTIFSTIISKMVS